MEIASYVWVTRGDIRISPRMYQVADMWQGLSESPEFPTEVKEVLILVANSEISTIHVWQVPENLVC